LKTNLKRFSGYRIRFEEPAKQVWAWGNLKHSVQQLVPIFQAALQEPFFVDDNLRQSDPLGLIMFALRDGEIFACFADDELVGICSFRDIKHERSAIYDGWATPAMRARENKDKVHTLFREMMDYAFNDFGAGGLGLKKVKCDIAEANIPALVTTQALGFQQVGTSPLDAFHNGELHDSVLLELLNPKFFGSAVEDIKPDEFRRGIEQASTGTTIHTDEGGASIRSATGSERDSAASDEREADHNPGELPGGLHYNEQEGESGWSGSSSGEPETRQRPIKPRGSGPLRELLLSKSDKPTNRSRKSRAK
jgi:RimJ/RimL family protein N-acetyltransferase